MNPNGTAVNSRGQEDVVSAFQPGLHYTGPRQVSSREVDQDEVDQQQPELVQKRVTGSIDFSEPPKSSVETTVSKGRPAMTASHQPMRNRQRAIRLTKLMMPGRSCAPQVTNRAEGSRASIVNIRPAISSGRKWQPVEEVSTGDHPMNRKGDQRHDGIGDREGQDQEGGDRAASTKARIPAR